MLSIKSANDGLHYGTAHKIRLTPYPETLTVDIESPCFPLIKPESEIGGSLYPLLCDMYAFQPGFKFFAKIGLNPGTYRP